MKNYLMRNVPKARKYPCLMEDKTNENVVVRFTAPGCGRVIHGDNLFYHGIDWNMDNFETYHGSVIFENE